MMSRQATPESAPSATDDLGAALVLHENGCFPAAIRCYRRVLSSQPENTLGHYLLGLALMAQGDTLGARGEWEAAGHSSDEGPQSEWARGCATTLLDRVQAGS
jgi:Flp pilus assembly protein TadD